MNDERIQADIQAAINELVTSGAEIDHAAVGFLAAGRGRRETLIASIPCDMRCLFIM
jgi:hypothetical protein